MPIYIVSLTSCHCLDTPDMVLRADDMVSAVIQGQDKLELLKDKAFAAGVEFHEDLKIEGICEAPFELMDEQGIQDVVSVWKEFAGK